LNGPVAITPAKMITLGVGWFGFEIFWAFHTGPMPLFLRDFTDSKFTISLVLSLAGLAGCIVPFAVGYLSDRSATRFGRRRPYIFLGFLGVLLCLLGLPRVTTFGMVALLSGWMYFSLRFAETPYLSLLPDITPPEQRSTASGVMHFLGTLGLIGCFLVSSKLWDEHPNAVFLLVAFGSFGFVLLAMVLIKEPPAVKEESSATSVPLSYLRSIAAEGRALRFFGAQFFWWLGFWMVSSFSTLFVVEELKVSEGDSFLVLAVFSVVATLFMLPLGMLGDRFGRKGVLSVFVASWAAAQIVIGFSQNLTHALLTVGISAIPFAGAMAVGLAYMLDLVPRNRTAEFVGFSVISVAVAQIVGPLIGGKLIDVIGYRSIFPAAAASMIVGLILLQLVPARPGSPRA
jgi:maltose/moltooligosaccharide transporter